MDISRLPSVQWDRLRALPLFHGLDEETVRSLLQCPEVTCTAFSRDTTIWQRACPVTKLGLLLTGTLRIEQCDFWGNRTILRLLPQGSLFGEAYAMDSAPLENDVVAHTEATVVFLPVSLLFEDASPLPGKSGTAIYRNLLRIAAERCRFLTAKLSAMSQRSTRDKLMAYLSHEACMQLSSVITLPFSRTQLADYLAVERTGLYRAIRSLEEEGYIRAVPEGFALLQSSENPA
ncbi:MAG: Crp/Fnr family transcriptional regulator [Clostridia bacterium]|nr:Crp/Fnr family transcriptional regulator [Clostridia bacterium]